MGGYGGRFWWRARGQPLLIGANEKARVQIWARVLNAADKISVQFLGKRPMKRHPA
jgi:hypothetical protein